MEFGRENFLIGDFFKKHEGGRIFFGEKIEGREIVHISEVERGLACACVCPECGERLIAKKGKAKKQIHHFAHEANANDRECYSPGETALHKLAKDIIAKRREITLPAVSLKRQEYEVIRSPALDIVIDSVSLEKRVGRVIPDVICEYRGTPFFVEFAVTHFCDNQKISYLKDIGISTMEINLAAFKEKKVKNIEDLILRHAPREWLWNRRYDEMSREMEDKIAADRKINADKRKFEIKRHVQFFLADVDIELFDNFDFEEWIAGRAALHGLDVVSFLNDRMLWYNSLWLGIERLQSNYSANLVKLPDDMMGLPIFEAFMKKIEAAERVKKEAQEATERAKKEAREKSAEQVEQRMRRFLLEIKKCRNKGVHTWKLSPNPDLGNLTPYQAVRTSEEKFEQAVEMMRMKFLNPR